MVSSDKTEKWVPSLGCDLTNVSTVSVENSVDGLWTLGLMRFVAFVERKSEVTKRTRERSDISLNYDKTTFTRRWGIIWLKRTLKNITTNIC